MYSKSLCAVDDIYISVTEHYWKLKVSMQTHLTQINTVFEYCHASMNLDHVDILYFEMGMFSPEKKEPQLCFFSKNFSSLKVGHQAQRGYNFVNHFHR